MTLAEVKNKLETDQRWQYRALVVLYQRQTDSEQVDKKSKIQNGVGFTGPDATILTSFAQFFEKNGFLTGKQQVILNHKIVKYSKQILEEIEKQQSK